MKFLLFLILISKSFAIIIDCEFNHADFTYLHSIYICDVKNYTDEGNHVITQIRGNTENTKAYSDVQGIYLNLQGKNLTYIPRGFENFFPNLIAIFVYEGEIEELNGDDLKELKNLEYFAIEFNPLEKIPQNLFANNPKMKNIFFDNNKITHVAVGFLDGLNDLQRVYFSNNPCSNFDAESTSDIEMLKSFLIEHCDDIKTTTEAPLTLNLETTTEKVLDLVAAPSLRVAKKLTLCDDFVNEKLEKILLENQEIKKMLKEILQKVTLN